jgi:surface antigen
MPIHKGLNGAKFLLSLLVIVVFAYMMVYADKFFTEEYVPVVNPIFVQQNISNLASIDLRSLEIVEVSWNAWWVLQYVVQAWDNIWSIASQFGTTIAHLRKINNIGNGPIRAGQRLIVTDEQEGFVYTMKERMSIGVFAEMYSLNKEDLMTLNYIQDETEVLHEWQEIFINISMQQWREKLLLDPQRIVPTPPPRPIVTQRPRVTTSSNNWWSSRSAVISNPNNNTAAPAWSNSNGTNSVISRWTYNQRVQNGFYAWYCTWYAAIISPSIFGPVVDGVQNRPFGGNANQRYRNAQAAWFSVWKTPRVWAIAVYNRLRSSAWHVAVVRHIEWNRMIVEDMNYEGKFIVTRRRENISNVDIGYIYP